MHDCLWQPPVLFMRRVVIASLLAPYLLTRAFAQSWCGKHYKASQSVVAPGGQFPVPSPSSDTFLALRCSPAIRPYLAQDTSSPAAILVDALVVHSAIDNAVPITFTDYFVVGVEVIVDGQTIGAGEVPLNATAHEVPIRLDGLTPRKAPYEVSCQGGYAGQMLKAQTTLAVLPDPTSGSVTKMDLRTGALLAKPATGLGGEYEPVFPIGFYTNFDGYLDKNISLVDELKEQGQIHPLPFYSNLTAWNLVLDRMQELGLYLMYEMYDYMNASSATEQVNAIKNRPNLLLWYTADEPDGQEEPFNATTNACDLIYGLDGYHPVSLVLNCQDYYWTTYAAGGDVIMQDVYMVGNNNSWSTEWNTTCTPDYGDCGCDNCASIPEGDTAAVPPGSIYSGKHVPANSGIGSFFDVSDRVASYRNRMEVVGWERSKTVWTVPQAFGGGQQYWTRMPTGLEWVVQSVMGINQGAMGIVSWNDPTSADIKASASGLARSLPAMTPYWFDPGATRIARVVGGASVATWKKVESTLVLATNANYVNQRVGWGDMGVEGVGARMVFASGEVHVEEGGFVLGPVASAGFVVDA